MKTSYKMAISNCKCTQPRPLNKSSKSTKILQLVIGFNSNLVSKLITSDLTF